MAPQEKAHVSQSNVRFLDHRSNVCSWSMAAYLSLQNLAHTCRKLSFILQAPKKEMPKIQLGFG